MGVVGTFGSYALRRRFAGKAIDRVSLLRVKYTQSPQDLPSHLRLLVVSVFLGPPKLETLAAQAGTRSITIELLIYCVDLLNGRMAD